MNTIFETLCHSAEDAETVFQNLIDRYKLERQDSEIAENENYYLEKYCIAKSKFIVRLEHFSDTEVIARSIPPEAQYN